MIYLDNSSTTRQYDEVTELIYEMGKDFFGNPSSLHNLGFEVSKRMDTARKQTGACLPKGGLTIFTSGGTESDNMAIFGAARKMRKRGNKVITSAAEHPAVLESCKRLEEDGFTVVRVGTDKDGVLDMDAFRDALDDDTVLVTLMTVNNENGVIMPVLEAYRMVQEYNREHKKEILFHSDAVQAFGKLDLRTAPFDMISISGHKIHAPKGVGALWFKDKLHLPGYIVGGGQERGYRSSTENTSGIVGMGLASEMACKDLAAKQKKLTELNDHLREGLFAELKDLKLNGPEEIGLSLEDSGKRCPSVLNISFLGTRGEVLLHTLEQDGIFVSTGSACHSNKTGDSHVLQAMGMDHKKIEGAIRFSLSEFNTMEEIDIVVDKVAQAVNRFRRLGSFR